MERRYREPYLIMMADFGESMWVVAAIIEPCFLTKHNITKRCGRTIPGLMAWSLWESALRESTVERCARRELHFRKTVPSTRAPRRRSAQAIAPVCDVARSWRPDERLSMPSAAPERLSQPGSRAALYRERRYRSLHLSWA